MKPKTTLTSIVVTAALIVCGCGSKGPDPSPDDTFPPAQVQTLSVGSRTASSITLSWTAVGDDGSTGKATNYDMRYSTTAISSQNWSQAVKVSGLSTPATAGSSESFTVQGLTPSTQYYFALIVADDAGNSSPLSNISNAMTLANNNDQQAPHKISDLQAFNPSAMTISLIWTVPFDEPSGQVLSYEIRYSNSPIRNDQEWSASQIVQSPPAPEYLQNYQTFIVKNLTPGQTYYFAIKSQDESANSSEISNYSSNTTIPGYGHLERVKTVSTSNAGYLEFASNQLFSALFYLSTFDLTNGDDPQLSFEGGFGNPSVLHFQIKDHYLYSTSGSILDITNPGNPSLVHTLTNIYGTSDFKESVIGISAQKLYLSYESEFAPLEIFDLANPSQPSRLYPPSSTPDPSWVLSHDAIFLNGNNLITSETIDPPIGQRYTIFRTYDVSNTQTPFQIGLDTLKAQYSGFAQLEESILVGSNGNNGLIVLELAPNGTINILAENSYGFSVHTSISFPEAGCILSTFEHQFTGVAIFDFKNPSAPRIVAESRFVDDFPQASYSKAYIDMIEHDDYLYLSWANNVDEKGIDIYRIVADE